jgi:hypothetical protein
VTSTDEGTERIRAHEKESYKREVEEWKKVEVVHVRLLAVAERERQERMRREYASHMSELGVKRIAELAPREGNDGGDEGAEKGNGGGGEEEEHEGGEEEMGEVVGGVSSSEGAATPMAVQDHTNFEEGCGPTQPPPTDTPLAAHSSQNTSSELITFTEITQSTTSPLPSPNTTPPQTHPPQSYIIPPHNDIITKTRSNSVDSGHSSNCNLGNRTGSSSHGNVLVNGCHADEHVEEEDSLVEWNGDGSGMDLGLEGREGLTQSTLTIVPDGTVAVEEGEEMVLDERGRLFADELLKIDKDIPRCDRDYWFFKEPGNLAKLRNIVTTYVWGHLDDGYSQGMCDLLAPLLVVLQDEALTYACYQCLMKSAILLFPPHTDMNSRLSNLKALLQVLEPDFFQYLSERPLGDGLFYCYRWFLVSYKREFKYSDVFRLWETWWAAREVSSAHFLEFCGLAIMAQFK